MDGLGCLLYAGMTALIAWRVYAGGLMARDNQEASMLMNLPLWIPYMLMVPGLLLCTVVGLYQAYKYWTTPAPPRRPRSTRPPRSCWWRRWRP